jgi:hypothetical protein
MTRMTPLLERNEQFAAAYSPPRSAAPVQVLIVTCLDYRVDPAIVLGLQLGRPRYPARFALVPQQVTRCGAPTSPSRRDETAVAPVADRSSWLTSLLNTRDS